MTAVRQIGPYALIAGLCALLNIAVLIGGDAAGLHYALSTTLSFALCVVVGYALHCRFTFRAAPEAAGFGRYVAAMALNYPLSLAAVWLFHDAAGLPMSLAAIAATAALTCYNFLSSRWAIALNGRLVHEKPGR